MKTSITPGDWRTNTRLDTIESVTTGETIATMGEWQGDGERMGNCKAIAALPKLIAALNRAKDYLIADPVAASALAQARAALKDAGIE